jgi:ATP-dependent Lon protease
MNETALSADLVSGEADIFEGRLVRKDLVLKLRGAFNVPIYVLEFLLGRYCNSNDLDAIREGLDHVRSFLTEHYARPDEAEQIKAKTKQRGTFKVIDKFVVRLSESEDRYWGELVNLNIKNINLADSLLDQYPMVVGDGVWAEIELGYDPSVIQAMKIRPFYVAHFKPIQLTRFNISEITDARARLDREAWLDLILRSVGLEPEHFDHRLKMLLLTRLIPYVEANYNLVELGPRGTGKSFVYEQISPYATLVSGGKATVAQLFVNNANGRMGLVGLWDVVAFDEVGGMKMSEGDAIQIFKGYLESGFFSRGKQQYTAQGSVAFLGNINFDVRSAGQARHLFEPFPEKMQDLAFLDRLHAYVPGWEIPKMKPEFFTTSFGLMVDYFAAFLREQRKTSYVDLVERDFRFGSSLNARDVKAVKKTVSGLTKLLHPGGEPSKTELEEYAMLGLELRRRVKEQLKRMGGVEYHATNLSMISNETGKESIVTLGESGSASLIPGGLSEAGVVYAAGADPETGKATIFRLEATAPSGTGKAHLVGGGGGVLKQAFEIATGYLRKHGAELISSKSPRELDLHLQATNILNSSAGSNIATGMALALASAIAGIPVRESLVVLGGLTLQGAPVGLAGFADILQVVADAGAQRVLVPVENRRDISLMPAEILDKLDLMFYGDPKTAINKGLSDLGHAALG